MKSMITALWERAKGRERVERANPSEAGEMKFSFGDMRAPGSCGFSLDEDTSLMHSAQNDGDFGVYLAGNWRFEVHVDSETGECLKLTAFMSKLTAKRASLKIPESKPMKMIFSSPGMNAGMACYSATPANSVHFDPEEKILCIGDPDGEGEAGEFADKTTAVIKDGRLTAVWLDLKDVPDNRKNGIALGDCLVVV